MVCKGSPNGQLQVAREPGRQGARAQGLVTEFRILHTLIFLLLFFHKLVLPGDFGGKIEKSRNPSDFSECQISVQNKNTNLGSPTIMFRKHKILWRILWPTFEILLNVLEPHAHRRLAGLVILCYHTFMHCFLLPEHAHGCHNSRAPFLVVHEWRTQIIIHKRGTHPAKEG